MTPIQKKFAVTLKTLGYEPEEGIIGRGSYSLRKEEHPEKRSRETEKQRNRKNKNIFFISSP